MAYPTSINNQITDAVTQTDVAVVADSPAMAMGTAYQSMAHSVSILFQNAVAAQQQQNSLAAAAANMGVMQIYSLDTVATSGASEKIGTVGTADSLTTMLAVMQAMKNEG